jgi:hypothetical protein
MARGRPRYTATALTQVNVYVDPERWERVRRVSEMLRIPISELVRSSLDEVLALAESQMNTLERVIAAEASHK